jgi:hypothetical protein
VTLRPTEPEDKPLLAAIVERLSEELSYWRFFTSKTELSPAELDYLVHVDHFAHEAIIAIDDSSGEGGASSAAAARTTMPRSPSRGHRRRRSARTRPGSRAARPLTFRARRGRTPVYALAQTNNLDTLRLAEGVGESRRGWTPGRSSSPQRRIGARLARAS